jgi:hypothetical protein
MRLSTSKGETTTTYREHRIPLFRVAADEHFEETCEHLCSGGVRVTFTAPEDDGLDWD